MASLMSPSHGMFLLPTSPRRSPAPRTVREPPAPQQQPQPQPQQPQQQQQPQSQSEADNVEETYQALFCRAMYDYAAQDASALSFRRGDIIEVLNQQPSGWWDGLLGEERGWFPSNYVTLITLEEAELAFSGSDYSNGDGAVQSDSDTGVLGMSDAIMRGQVQNEDWLDNQISFVNEYVDNPRPTTIQPSQTNDFWEPNIMEDGRIFYVNSRTGQHAWDLPQETADEISESELAGLSSQSTVRAATGAGMAFGAAATTNGVNGTHDLEPAGFGVPRSTGTPEPWIKRLADDGSSYYYINKHTSEILWTRAEIPSTANSSHSDLEDTVPSSTARRPRAGSRSSVYSDDSDVHPLDYPRPPRSAAPERVRQQQNQAQPVQKFNLPHSGVSGGVVVQLTSEEVIAKQLQQALAPPPPELPTDLSSKARDAIQSILNNVHGTVGRAGDDQRMDDLIQTAVRAVRNLLYVSAANSSHIPTDMFAKETRERSSSSPLKPAQRRVTATLSRLVLSARAMHYDSGSHVSETLNRIETDAEELERAVALFITEVQRAQPSGGRAGGSPKRLYGTFTTANIGAGLVGAGSAGTWKGFGWVSQEHEEQAPRRPLSQEAVAEVSAMLGKTEDLFAHLAQALVSSKDGSVEQLRQNVQDLVSYISHFIRFVADIHIARHVDIDGIRQASDTVDDMYAQTLAKARGHVRTLETAFQAAYDDSSSLLLTAQVLLSSDPACSPEDRMVSFTALESSASSLRANLSLVQETLEALLSVGHEQADIAQGDYNGSIEWRMSRLSMIHTQFGGAARTSQEFPNGREEEDALVEFDDVLTRPIPPAKGFRPSVDTLVDLTRPSVESVDRISSTAGESYTDVSALGTVAEDDVNDEELMEMDKPKKISKPKKLDSILGPEYADKIAAESQPWYLRSNYNPSEIIIDEADNSVKAGTVPALVEKLTAHNQVDLPYSRAFLMTYKDFTSLDNLFDLLVQRFRTQPPENLAPNELNQWTKLKQHVIRTRVLNTFKNMITEQYVLDKDDMYILGRMKDFISQDDVAGMPAAKALKSLIDRAQSNGEVSIQSFVTTNQIPAPTPIIPRINKRLKLLDIDPLELARQLTIMESRMYQRIKPIEALRRARAQKSEIVDNIGVVIQTSNRIADWVADSILRKEDSKKRAQVVKYLINVADRCRILNNFSTMIAITSGLNTPPIRRLKRTWEQVNQRVIAQFAACEVTIDSSKTFAKYRQLMSSVTPPCVPFIGVFLSTLQFIIDGNPDYLPPDQLVNFFKRQKASEVMDDIKRWQATPYNLTPVPGILNFIEESLNQFSNTDTRASSDIFWKLSLEREPREREDEKMARLLQESGFL